MGTRPLLAGALAAIAVLGVPGPAVAKDSGRSFASPSGVDERRFPGRWRLAKVTKVPLAYNQGMTATASGAFVFASNTGLFATTKSLAERRVTAVAIPPDVQASEGYDHIGDPGYDRAEGGRLILPLECYRATGPNAGNHCGTGSIGVADPATLRWRYHVKLDPRDIKKAMWAEVTPDGRSLWTQSGSVLLRYAMRDVVRANAAPTGKLLRPVQRLRGALPPGQMSGAAFSGGRLFVATQPDAMQIWSIDLRRGKRRLEIERPIRGEAEGLTVTRALGGTLHFLVAPFDPKGRKPTYGGGGAVLTFERGS